ncbi:uncharacterized protein LOC111398017 [Olea europaea var. sylvestris]|uniref:uncharacterized protein LOC111398017 n=1 Tax=Olea europaea var. sylvestris TaxID=158386 RepID=UPI000C1D2082|nr:uncharacterized protein LOC111398017 [Olea europaea var. sylvestris]
MYGHSNDSHRVHYYYGYYDPLLVPYGESGWHQGIDRHRNAYFQPQHMSTSDIFPNTTTSATEFIEKENEVPSQGKKRTQVSCREYYSYKLQIRTSGKSVMLHDDRLFQQYVVDIYVKIETARLDYFLNNQKQIHAELYEVILLNLKFSKHIILVLYMYGSVDLF